MGLFSFFGWKILMVSVDLFTQKIKNKDFIYKMGKSVCWLFGLKSGGLSNIFWKRRAVKRYKFTVLKKFVFVKRGIPACYLRNRYNISVDTVTGGDRKGQLPKRCIISRNKTVGKTHLKKSYYIDWDKSLSELTIRSVTLYLRDVVCKWYCVRKKYILSEKNRRVRNTVKKLEIIKIYG